MELDKIKTSQNPKVQELYQKLVNGVEKVATGEEMTEFLKFAAHFWKYSMGNVVLIHTQKLDATWVAGLKTWNKLERRVKKGEHGIAILAPTVKKVRVKKRDAETGEEQEREEERLLGFHVAYVFDVSQTEGKPLPEHPGGKSLPDSELADTIYRQLLEAAPAPVVTGYALEPGTRGEFDPVSWEIHISGQLTTSGDLARTLMHECAHALAFKLNIDTVELRDGETYRQRYDRREAVAEGATFVAAATLGFDTYGISTGYIASYVPQAEKLWEYLEDVHKVAEALIALIEGAKGERVA